MIKEKMDLDIEVAKLRLMKADYQSNQFKLEDQILKQYPEEIRQAQERAMGYRADMALLKRIRCPRMVLSAWRSRESGLPIKRQRAKCF